MALHTTCIPHHIPHRNTCSPRFNTCDWDRVDQDCVPKGRGREDARVVHGVAVQDKCMQGRDAALRLARTHATTSATPPTMNIMACDPATNEPRDVGLPHNKTNDCHFKGAVMNTAASSTLRNACPPPRHVHAYSFVDDAQNSLRLCRKHRWTGGLAGRMSGMRGVACFGMQSPRRCATSDFSRQF